MLNRRQTAEELGLGLRSFVVVSSLVQGSRAASATIGGFDLEKLVCQLVRSVIRACKQPFFAPQTA